MAQPSCHGHFRHTRPSRERCLRPPAQVELASIEGSRHGRNDTTGVSGRKFPVCMIQPRHPLFRSHRTGRKLTRRAMTDSAGSWHRRPPAFGFWTQRTLGLCDPFVQHGHRCRLLGLRFQGAQQVGEPGIDGLRTHGVPPTGWSAHRVRRFSDGRGRDRGRSPGAAGRSGCRS